MTGTITMEMTGTSTMENHGPSAGCTVPTIQVERPYLDQATYEDLYPNIQEKHETQALCAKDCCNRACLQRRVLQYVPCIGIMKDYKPKHQLVADVVAGIVVAIVAIPQGMAYAMLAAVPAVFGLYGSFLPPMIYFIFGTSRHISIGTFALASVIIGNFVATYDCSQEVTETNPPSQNNTDDSLPGNMTLFSGSGFSEEEQCQISVALCISLMAGVIQFGLGLLHVGFVSTYMSYPQTRAFTCASSVIVLLGQIKGLLQLDLPRRSGPLMVYYVLYDIVQNIQHTNWFAAVLSIASIIILVICKKCVEPDFKKKFRLPIPIELILVILMILVSYFGKIHESQGVEILGDVPTGFPTPRIPPLTSYNLVELLPTAVSAAIVGFANAMSYAKVVAREKGYDIDGNQELFAHGLMNVFGSMCNAVMSSATLSRSSIAVAAGATTQLFGVIASALMLLVILFLGFVFNPLPNCILSSIIVVALHGLILQITDLKSLWRIDKVDFCTWLLTFILTLVLDVSLGLYTSLVIVVLTLIYHSQMPKSSIRGQLPGTEIYLNVKEHSQVKQIKGIAIFRFESALHFANVENFMQKLQSKTKLSIRQLKARDGLTRVSSTSDATSDKTSYQMIEEMGNSAVTVFGRDEISPPPNGICEEVKSHDKVHSLIIDCSAVSYVDSVGASTLIGVVKEYQRFDIYVRLACCNDTVRRTLMESGFLRQGSLQSFYLTVHDAVKVALHCEAGVL